MEKEDLDPLREKEAENVRKEVQVQGFRKGKAPLNMVKRQYAQAIEAYAMEAAIQEGLIHVSEKENMMILGRPEAKNMDMKEDGSLELQIVVETYPEVDLKKYTGFELIRDVYDIQDTFIDQTIQRLREERAEILTVDTEIGDHYLVSADLQEVDQSGVPIVGKKYNDIHLQMGKGRFDAELEKQLIGLKQGDERIISKKYPDDFPQKEYAGKVESYSVKIKKVEKQNLPELDEEFIKDLSLSEVTTVSEFREFTRRNLQENYDKEAERRLLDDLARSIVEANPFEVPQVLIENYLNNIVEDVKQKNPRIRESEIRQYYENDALFNIKWYYLQEKIEQAEKITVDESDTETFLTTLRDESIREIYRKNIGLMERAKDEIRTKKITGFLIGASKLTENKIELK
jgi:trigger factor